MANAPDIGTVWNDVQAQLPGGWSVDSLRCASTGLTAAQRSEDWIAIALAPDGAERAARAATPEAALRGWGADRRWSPRDCGLIVMFTGGAGDPRLPPPGEENARRGDGHGSMRLVSRRGES